MTTLYRQYRPKLFSELSGQEHITQVLSAAVTRDRVAHAYLFHGPRGTGKTTTARILAKRVNCAKSKIAEPCGKCPLCVATQNNQNIDIIEIDAASNRGIDDIRALKDAIGLKPGMGKYKVYIIDEVHMLTKEAFTALLKTLEEPVAHAIFILATTDLHKVPETILSRCQVFRFRRATTKELQSRLQFLLKQEKREVEPAALDFIIHRSDGCFRDAESLLGQLLTLHDRQITLSEVTEFLGLPPQELISQFIRALLKAESAPALAAIDQAFSQGFDPEQFTRESIVRSRDAAVLGATTNDQTFADIPGAYSKFPAIIRALLQALQDLAYVPQPLIALQVAVLTVCTQKGSVAPTAPAPTPVVAVTRSENIPEKKRPPVASTNAVTVEQVQTVWPDLIQHIRAKNPVAATFLRAVSAAEIDGSIIRLRANYALHRNFFDKPENQQIVQEALSTLLKTPVTVRCFLDQGDSSRSAAPTAVTPQPEQDLLAAVKEVFGKP